MQFGLSESVVHWGRYHPDHPAVLTNGKTISYGILNATVDRVAIQLRAYPVRRVAVACDSKYNLLVAILATLRAGKGVVLLNTELSDDALRTNLAKAKVKVLLHDEHSKRVPDLVRQRRGRLIAMSPLPEGAGTPIENEPRANIHWSARFSRWLEGAFHIHRDARASHPNRLPKDEWGVIYSSGTTGTPKGIVRYHDSMVTEFIGWIIELGLNRATTFYIGRPIYYTGGFVLAGATLLVCGTIIMDDVENDNDPEEAWRSFANALQVNEIDWAFFIPDQLQAFIKTDRMPTLPRPPRNVLVMGGLISGEEKLAVSRLLGCNVIESWGNSESLGTITEAGDLHARPASIGRPFLCDELFIVDEKRRRLPCGEQGRIVGGLEAGFACYTSLRKETKEALRGGLINSEDYGYQDADGYFYIRGRLSDRIVRNGEFIFPPQIELVIRSDDQISVCCVTAVGGQGSEKLVMIVPPATKGDAETIRTRINKKLRPNECIDYVLFMAIPRVGGSGKIDRVACRKIAEDNCGA